MSRMVAVGCCNNHQDTFAEANLTVRSHKWQVRILKLYFVKSTLQPQLDYNYVQTVYSDTEDMIHVGIY